MAWSQTAPWLSAPVVEVALRAGSSSSSRAEAIRLQMAALLDQQEQNLLV